MSSYMLILGKYKTSGYESKKLEITYFNIQKNLKTPKTSGD